MEITIFYGNGINLAAGGCDWNDILRKMSNNCSLPNISSNTLKYEYIILPKRESQKVPWLLNGQMFVAGGFNLSTEINMENDIIKKGLCEELRKQPRSPYYTELARLNAQYYVTTNYELILNEEFEGFNFFRNMPRNDIVRLYARDVLSKDGDTVMIWNIHGNWNAPESIILGIKDYCEYVTEINQYIKEGNHNHNLSWIDLFLKTDVYIIGFGLAYEETDIWYVLTYRKRLIRQKKYNINNHIYYYIPNKYADKGKMDLLEAMDVEVVCIPFISNEENTNNNLFDLLKDKIGERNLFYKKDSDSQKEL